VSVLCHATWVTGRAQDSRLVLALVPTVALALYYAALFHAPPWGASNMTHLPPPDIAVLAAAFGPLLLAALPAVLARRPATAVAWQRTDTAVSGKGSETVVGSGMGRLEAGAPGGYDAGVPGRLEADGLGRCEHASVSVPHPTAVGPRFAMRPWSQAPVLTPQCPCAAMRPRSQAPASSRVIVVWAVVNPLLLLLPLPQSGRLVSGWSVALALLAAVTLGGMRQVAARRVVGALALSNVTLALLYLAVTWRAANPAYYAPADETAAVQWVAAHAGSADVVMASAGSGNLVVSAARCRVVVGQNFETFDWARAQRDVRDFYGAMTDRLARAAIVRRQHVTLVMAGPYERALGRFNPGEPGYRLVYAGGTIHVYAVRKD